MWNIYIYCIYIYMQYIPPWSSNAVYIQFHLLIITLNGFFFIENIPVGHSCLFDLQCTGTEFANVCKNRECGCQSGYILISNTCYEGKELLHFPHH